MSNKDPMRPWRSPREFKNDLSDLYAGNLPPAPEPYYDYALESPVPADPSSDQDTKTEKEARFRAEVEDCADIAGLRSLLEERHAEALLDISNAAEQSRDLIREAGDSLSARLEQAERVDNEQLAQALTYIRANIPTQDYQLIVRAVGDRLGGIVREYLDHYPPQHNAASAFINRLLIPKDLHDQIRTISDPYVLRTVEAEAYTSGEVITPGFFASFTRSYISTKAQELLREQYSSYEENSDGP